MKICSKCGKEGLFVRDKSRSDGLRRTCKNCTYRYMKEWKLKNPKKFSEYAKKNYANNIEKCRTERRLYYKQNKEQMNERIRNNYLGNKEFRSKQIEIWQKANPNKVKKASCRRRSLEVNARGFATDEQIAARVQVYGGMCAYCVVKKFEHIDHVIPLSRGGSNWPANLRPACETCNLSKNAKTWHIASFGKVVGGDSAIRFKFAEIDHPFFRKNAQRKFNYKLRERFMYQRFAAMGILFPEWLANKLKDEKFLQSVEPEYEDIDFDLGVACG